MSATTTYAHPYIAINIYDNTGYSDEEEEVVERKEFNGLQVGFFAGGRDNTILYLPDRETYLNEYCNPNFKKFGQAAYNVDAALSTGNCGMYVLNLRPETATHANIVVMVKFKIVTPEQTETEQLTELQEPAQPYLSYSFYGKTISGGTDEDTLLTSAVNLMETSPDGDGYYNMPLFTIYTIGRGDYGNNIRLRMENVTNYDAGYDEDAPTRHTYAINVMEPGDKGLKIMETNYGTFDEDAFDASVSYGPSLYIGDVINDVEYGSQRVHASIYLPTYEAICKLYNDTFAPTTPATPYTLDIFTGKTLEGETDQNIKLDTNIENYLNLFSLDGFQMSSGSDGWEGMEASEISQSMTSLLIQAYAGDIDPMINSRFSTPCNFNLDANYELEVKRQMAALANKRRFDCMTYLDTKLVSTTSGLVTFLQNIRSVYGYNVIKEGHCYRWRDTLYTGKVCDMTITHWIAKALPNHMADTSRGLGIPMATDLAILRSKEDYIPGSFKPVIEPDNNDLKEELYALRCNCYQTLNYNSVQRATSITTCTSSKSDRILEMNEYITQRAVKLAYDILSSKMYKLGEDDDRAQYLEDATDIINHKLSGYIKKVTVEFEMTDKDKKKSLLRLKLHIVFKTVVQRGEIDIYLDPRVVEEAA